MRVDHSTGATTGIAFDGERAVSLSTMPADRRVRQGTYAVLLLIFLGFAAVAPFASVQLPPLQGFVLIYGVALSLINIFTATLLLSRFSVFRARSLLVLAGGYLFTAFIAIPHALSFPGVFTPAGLLGGGSQTTAWLYEFWHGGFPLAVIGYALLKGRAPENERADESAWPSILATLAIVAATVIALTLLASWGDQLLPRLVANGRFTATNIAIVRTLWVLSFVALAVLLLKKPYTALDLWLMVVMGAWLADTGLTGVFAVARFDVAWYAGRIFGLAASSILLIMLLSETGALYARFARAVALERKERERKLGAAAERLVNLSRLIQLRQMVNALAHELRQRLSAVTSSLSAGDALIGSGDISELRAEFERAGEQAARATQLAERLCDYATTGEITRRNEDLAGLIDEVTALALTGAEGPAITLELHLQPNCSWASIDRAGIQQVLLSLITNAAEATRDSPERSIIIRGVPAETDMIEISVSDSGPGIAPEVRDTMFDPFTTTKPVGLSICRSIVEQHGGRIWLAKSDGRGATFCFTVPRGVEDDSTAPAYARDMTSAARVSLISSAD